MRTAPSIFILKTAATSVTLGWHIPSNPRNLPTALQITRSTPPDPRITIVARLQGDHLATGTYTDTRLRPDTAYRYTVCYLHEQGARLCSSIEAHTSKITETPPAQFVSPEEILVLPTEESTRSPHLEQSFLAATVLTPYARGIGCRQGIQVWWNTNAGGVSIVTIDRVSRYQTLSPYVSLYPPPANNSWIDTRVSCGAQYTYIVHLYRSNRTEIMHNPTNSTSPICCAIRTSSYLIQGFDDTPTSKEGSLLWITPQASEIHQYVHERPEITDGQWKLTDRLMLPHGYTIHNTDLSLLQMADGKLSIIATIVKQPLQALATKLIAFEQGTSTGWSGPIALYSEQGPITRTTGTQALIQSINETQQRFELLVPGGNSLLHYTHDHESPTEGPWHLEARLAAPQDSTGHFVSVSLAQGANGHLLAAAHLVSSPGAENDFIALYEYTPGADWSRAFGLKASDAPGPLTGVTAQTLIHTTHATFELLLARGTTIEHYSIDDQNVQELAWEHLATLPPSTLQLPVVSLSGVETTSGNLEVVARLSQVASQTDPFIAYAYSPGEGWQSPIEPSTSTGPIVASKLDTAPSKTVG